MPEQWEWSCDYCGKHVLTNSQATRPPGWVPKGRTIGTAHDFCSPEHEAAYKTEGQARVEDAPAKEESSAEDTSAEAK
jgi:hypothetical protein